METKFIQLTIWLVSERFFKFKNYIYVYKNQTSLCRVYIGIYRNLLVDLENIISFSFNIIHCFFFFLSPFLDHLPIPNLMQHVIYMNQINFNWFELGTSKANSDQGWSINIITSKFCWNPLMNEVGVKKNVSMKRW
jgi:hypothetical protein